MKNKFNQKGITLISLVITIILLIILAGIAIKLSLEKNGIFDKAKQAKEDYLYAANTEQDKLKNVEISIDNGDIEPEFTRVANAPDITRFNKSKTYYVSWSLENNLYEIEENRNLNRTAPSNWYDYTEGTNHWANVKTTGGENDCYWVWIPRYAYKVPSRTTPGTIEVKFLEGTTNTPIDKSDITISNNTTEGSWNVPPAFWWDKNNDGQRTENEELTGIWVAKFEASSSDVSEATIENDLNTYGGGNNPDLKVRVKPNVTSWRYITLGNIFKVCQALTETGNSLEGTNNNIDSHMMKNTEWGAVVYLSRSVYGKNSPVWNNPYYSDTNYYSTITGLCGKGDNNQNLSTTNINDTCKYNEQKGGNASTTGNVYGVYDMAGGSWEYVAGLLNSNTSNSTYYDFTTISTKYYDGYNNYDNTKYGDAIYETSSNSTGTASWDTDYSYFISPASPVFVRGGLAMRRYLEWYFCF